ncbi:hypothetical protein ACFW5L_29610 [Streptomyces albidoflavus]
MSTDAGECTAPSEQEYESAYGTWRASLTTLLGDSAGLARWQERRYQFAHRVGALLTGAYPGSAAVTGPVLYGVFAPGAGLCYVGQTQEAERRLRDLLVGESHHLATTLPPEIWERVVVVRWPQLLDAVPESERAAVEEMGRLVCGLALEHTLQVAKAPPLNSRRRQADGDWQPRDLARSRSRGAQHAQRLPQLGRLVLDAWAELSGATAPEHAPLAAGSVGRAVFPSALHES